MGGLVTWWLARTEDQLPASAAWLSEAERAHAASLRYAKRRTDFLLSRWTLKLAAQRVLGWPEDTAGLARIEARPAPGGAPRLFVDGQAAPHGISLTDRAGAAVCLIAAEPAAVGCDVEVAEPRSDAFIRGYLTGPEQQFVNGAGAARDTLANLVWSAKESALKVLGTGLRRDTRSVEVSVSDPAPPPGTWSPLVVRASDGGTFPGWWRRSGAFVLTACWPGSGPPPATLETASPLDTGAPSHSWLSRPLS